MLSISPFLTICAIAQEMIPQAEFYAEFSGLFIFSNNPFEELVKIWHPLLKLIEKKGKLISVSVELAEVHVDINSPENIQLMTAQWIGKLLERIEAKGQDSSLNLTRRLLPIVMKSPNPYSKIFLPKCVYLII